MQIGQLKQHIFLDELSEEKFSIGESVKRAKEVLENLREVDEIFDGRFDDDQWIFSKHLSKGHLINIDFSVIKDATRFRDNWDSSAVIIIKCWIAELLSEYFPATVRFKLNLLIRAIEQTDFFSPGKLNEFVEYLRTYSSAVKQSLEETTAYKKEKIKRDMEGVAIVAEIINATFNFLTFFESDSFYVYHKPLLNIKKGLNIEKVTRELPKGKDVLKLDYCINQYFEGGLSTPSILFFAPVLLWWKITNIIPIRISEFCTIKRECIFEKNGSYYIVLPREKKPATQRRVQVVDTLEITKDIFDLIDNYIQLTNPYGKSKTMLSYKTLIAIDVGTSRFRKRYSEYFERMVFSSLLSRFYKEVVYGVYKNSIEREVRPNDTRHFAFCSLLMQGISPIEIARLGGHSTIEAQYHYSNHTEYFIDIEVDKLIKGFNRKDNELKGTTFDGNEISYRDIEKRSYEFPSINTRFPMEIGFCTDEFQQCQSTECMLCNYWWIHPTELVKIKPKIEEKIRERRQKIAEISSFLKNLNESFTNSESEVSEVNPIIFNKMKTEAASVQEHLEQIARLKMLKGFE
jgi:integrase